jgi:hypothetical protein
VRLWFLGDVIDAWLPNPTGKSGHLHLPLKSQNPSTLPRRDSTLTPTIRPALFVKGPLDIVVDSIGLWIHGEGI